MTQYHNPVLLKECIEALNIDGKGNYVDVTFGGGGHSKEILKHITTGKLYAFDQDNDALKNEFDHAQFVLINQNFRYLKNFLKFYNAVPVDGILADLGVSSHQFDAVERGFSFRADAKLDMRMNSSLPKTAADVVNSYEEEKLANILFQYGEIRSSRAVASTIVKARQTKKIKTTFDLKNLLMPFAKPAKKEAQFFAQVFQALRIEVNEELQVLKEMLTQSLEVLKPGGRLVVMSYHSLEDRLVKNFMRTGNFEGVVNKDFFGNVQTPFEIISKKAIVPSEEEIKLNSRARSAKLRIAQKI